MPEQFTTPNGDVFAAGRSVHYSPGDMTVTRRGDREPEVTASLAPPRRPTSTEAWVGSVTDAEGDEIAVFADLDGVAVLRWEHGPDMVLGRVAGNRLRQLLDQASGGPS